MQRCLTHRSIPTLPSVMQVVEVITIFEKGSFCKSADYQSALADVRSAIDSISWPEGSGQFVINPVKDGNGVVPIRKQFQDNLVATGQWRTEVPFPTSEIRSPGRLDALIVIDGRTVAVEWETAHVTSSHRAVNKMALGILKGHVTAGILVISCRLLAKWLTDRVGNMEELEPYFELWPLYCPPNRSEAALYIVVVEHDGEDEMVPLIPKQRKRSLSYT
jgi:hypothetical protein